FFLSCLLLRPPPISPLFPYTTLFRSEMLRELRFPHSLGLLYSAFTYFTGFRVNSGEYKVMGLAPYGEPKYVKAIKDHLLEILDRDRKSTRLNSSHDQISYAVFCLKKK